MFNYNYIFQKRQYLKRYWKDNITNKVNASAYIQKEAVLCYVSKTIKITNNLAEIKYLFQGLQFISDICLLISL